MAHKHPVYDCDPHFVVNPITRTMKAEGSQKVCVIQYDHNSERFSFELPRYIEGHDMSLCNVIQVHYINIDSTTKSVNTGVYEVGDMQISPYSDETIVLTWLISQNATQLVGQLHFLLRFTCVDETGNVDYAWNSGINTGILVSKGIYNSSEIIVDYPDLLEQWRADIVGMLESKVSYQQMADYVDNQIGQVETTLDEIIELVGVEKC